MIKNQKFPSFTIATDTRVPHEIFLIADSLESLSVMEENGSLAGIFICPDMYASYPLWKIVQEIPPDGKWVANPGEGLKGTAPEPRVNPGNDIPDPIRRTCLVMIKEMTLMKGTYLKIKNG